MKHQARGNICGPKTLIHTRFPTDEYYGTMHITPYDSGEADIQMEGKPPPTAYIPEDEVIIGVESIKGTCRFIAEVLINYCPPVISMGYVINPGYIPDIDPQLNAASLLYPCGKPRGEHWHLIKTDPLTGEVPEEAITDSLGDHNQRDLGKLIYQALRHMWPKDVA